MSQGARVDIAEIREAGGLKPWLERQKAAIARPVLKPVPKRPKPARRSEHDEQCIVIARAEVLAPSVPELRLLFAIPNGGHRHKAVAGKLQAEGVRKGVPDLCLPVSRGGFHGLYVELKAQRDGRVSDEQKEWIAALQAQGYRAEVCVGADAAWRVICEYLEIDRG
ncbi:VRR-NUC domain-containing protein [Solidesulfovibrio sp.]